MWFRGPQGLLAVLMPLFLSYIILSALMEVTLVLGGSAAMHPGTEDAPLGTRVLGVVLSAAVISFFALAYLVPRPGARRDWRSMGLVQAFIIALYAEMYGFPLTVYLLASALGLPDLPGVMGRWDGHLVARVLNWLTGVSLPVASWWVMAASSSLMALGFCLIYAGWQRIHGAPRRLVDDGIYAYLRHPQYSGILTLTLGLLLHWPTIVTALLWPVVVFTYVRLARQEERTAEITFGAAYLEYRQRVPAFFPRLAQHPLRPGR